MTKRGKLTKIEKCYIENNLELGVKQVAEDLERTETIIQREFDIYIAEAKRQTVTSAKKHNVDSLMGKATNKGVLIGAVMTPAASELSDEVRKNAPKLTRKTQESIHRPKG